MKPGRLYEDSVGLVCIGGPLNGQVYSHRSRSFHVATFNGPALQLRPMAGSPFPLDVGAAMEIMKTSYSRKEVAYQWGGLVLAGEAWVWDQIPSPIIPQVALVSILGAIVAQAHAGLMGARATAGTPGEADEVEALRVEHHMHPGTAGAQAGGA